MEVVSSKDFLKNKLEDVEMETSNVRSTPTPHLPPKLWTIYQGSNIDKTINGSWCMHERDVFWTKET